MITLTKEKKTNPHFFPSAIIQLFLKCQSENRRLLPLVVSAGKYSGFLMRLRKAI